MKSLPSGGYNQVSSRTACVPVRGCSAVCYFTLGDSDSGSDCPWKVYCQVHGIMVPCLVGSTCSTQHPPSSVRYYKASSRVLGKFLQPYNPKWSSRQMLPWSFQVLRCRRWPLWPPEWWLVSWREGHEHIMRRAV